MNKHTLNTPWGLELLLTLTPETTRVYANMA